MLNDGLLKGTFVQHSGGRKGRVELLHTDGRSADVHFTNGTTVTVNRADLQELPKKAVARAQT